MRVVIQEVQEVITELHLAPEVQAQIVVVLEVKMVQMEF
jgi:hypothetical protein